jgi:hypothetical protein
MSMIEIDENAREILRDWKMIFSQQERLHVDYSEAIRIAANKINNLENKIKIIRENGETFIGGIWEKK